MQNMLQNVMHDLRYAVRQLWRSPGFTLTAVLTLALGIGATTAIFTLVYQVMLRSIPVEHPEQLYKVGKRNNCCVMGGGQDDWSLFSYDFYQYVHDHTADTEGMAAVQAGSTTMSARRAGSASPAQPLQVRYVSGNYFSLLGVHSYAGRLLTPEDDRAGAAPAAVVSYALWQAKFGGDPGLVGSTVILTGHPVTVAGITATNFLGERNEADAPGFWLPLAQEIVLEPERKLTTFPQSHWLDVLVRIEDRHRVPKVQLVLQAEVRQWIKAHQAGFPGAGITDKQIGEQTTELASASGGINRLRDQYERSLTLLLLVAGFVLLIACANLANLMLVRGMARQQQLAVRSALGAPRSRLIRQMLMEAIVLALLGGAAAIGVAYVGTHAILALALKGAESSPLSASPSLPVLGFALAVSLVTGILFGTAPAWIASRIHPVEALRGANRSIGDQSTFSQKLLVILQAALSLAVLSTAGLLITSLRQLEHQDFFFQPEGRLLVFTNLGLTGYTSAQLSGVYRQFDDALSRLPGVIDYSYATYGPMADNNWGTDVFFSGRTTAREDEGANYSSVSPGYFESLGTHVLLGRAIDTHDTATSVHVAVVNKAFADKYLKGKAPLGEHFGPDPRYASEFEIVGVVENTKYRDASEAVEPMFFTPITQTTAYTDSRDIVNEEGKHFATNLVIHYRGAQANMAGKIRQVFKAINPDIPVLRIVSYNDQLADQFTQEDLVVRLTTLFGVLALVLAALGLYGVTAYNVQRRTGEIGIRMALGASRGSVLGMIVRGALGQAAIGLALGVPLSLAAGRMLRSTLYNTPPFQPVVLGTVIGLLAIATLIAAALPARRASSIDPMQALRAE